MNLWSLSVKRPVFAWMFMFSLIFFGLISYFRLGISQMPDIDFPVANVSVQWPGASPEIIENEVVDIIESSLSGVEGVKSINSSTKRGQANITVEFELSRDINIGVQEIQAKLGQAQRRLPSDIEPPIVTKSNPEDQPIMWLSVTADTMSRPNLMAYVRDHIKDRFQTITGVSEITLGGYIDPNLRLWMNPRAMQKLDLTPLDIARAVEEQHQEVPGGSVDQNNQELIIRANGEAQTLEDFLNISILRRSGGINYSPIYLKEVVDAEFGLDDVKRIGRVNGKNAVGLGIRKVRGANAVAMGHRIKQKAEEISETLPKGISIGVNYDGTTFIEESIQELMFTVGLSALLTAFVVWLFIGSWSASFNIILSIPTVIIGSLFFMKWMGFTLNTFSMLGLILAVGIVVDDNIMVLENITRFGKIMKDRARAAIEGTGQIASAAVATGLALVAIFLPIAYMAGIVGKFFYEFAITFTICIVLSTLDALIFTPMRYSQIASAGHEKERQIKWMDCLTGHYKNSLQWSLNHPILTLLFSLLFILPVFILPKYIGKEFTPAQDMSLLRVMLKTKPGSSLGFTDEKAKQVEDILLNTPEVKRYYLAIGGFGGGESNSAFIFLTLLPKSDRPLRVGQSHIFSQNDVADELRQKISQTIPGLFAIIQDPSKQGLGSRHGASYDVELSVLGNEWPKLAELSEAGKKVFSESGLVKDVDSDFKGIVPELLITPMRELATKHGVSIQDINQTVDAAIRGKVLGKYSKEGRRFDIRLKYPDHWLEDIKFIKAIPIHNNRGETVPLEQVASVEIKQGLLSTRREDRQREISLSGNITSKLSHDKVLADLKARVEKILPKGYVVTESGQSEESQKTFQEFVFVFFLGIIVAYIVLASQYNSFLDPVIILLALPFSLTGAFIALLVTGVTLNIYSLIGLILLMGIVKKNSILLVEFANQTRRENLAGNTSSVKEILLYACPIRFRPIIMTSVTTIAGALPAALSLGPGAETKIPLAVTIIGGVIFSTILTLYIVPMAYHFLKRKN